LTCESKILGASCFDRPELSQAIAGD